MTKIEAKALLDKAASGQTLSNAEKSQLKEALRILTTLIFE